MVCIPMNYKIRIVNKLHCCYSYRLGNDEQILASLKLEKKIAENTSLLIYSSLYLNAFFTTIIRCSVFKTPLWKSYLKHKFSRNLTVKAGLLYLIFASLKLTRDLCLPLDEFPLIIMLHELNEKLKLGALNIIPLQSKPSPAYPTEHRQL